MMFVLAALAALADPVTHASQITAPVAVTLPTKGANAAEPILELTVTATRLPADPFSLPPMVSVVGPERLAQVQLDQAPNLLRNVPGILIQKSNHGGGSPFIHGLTGKQVLLLVDGVRMNNSLYRFGPHQYLNTIDPYMIERLEIVRGPASVLYGSDALGGVVNVVSKNPRDQTLGAGLAIGGASADESLRGRLQIDGHESNLGLLAGATAHRFGDLRAGGNVGVQPFTGYDAAAADLKISHRVNDDVAVVAATQLVRQYDVPKSNETLLGGKIKYDYEPQLRWLSYGQLHAQGLAIADRVVASVSMQAHQEGERIISRAGGPERRERNDARTYGTFVHFAKDVGFGNTLGFGGEWYTDRIDSEASEADTTGTRTAKPAFPDGARYQSFGVYLQDEWRPVHALGILVGGRYSRFQAEGVLADPTGDPIDLNLDVDDLTASAGLVWEFAPGFFAAGQAAQGFRAPNMEDFFGKVDFSREIPNTELKPEKSNDYEAGLRMRRWGARVEAFYFRSYYRDLIDRADVIADVDGDGAFERVAQRRNIGRARIHGVESGITYRIGVIESFATYALTFGDSYGKVNGRWEAIEPLRRVPPRQGSAGVRYIRADRDFVGAELEWAKRQDRLAAGDESDPRIGPMGTPGYVVTHLRSGVGLGANARLRVGVENVFDNRYKDHGSGIWYAGRSFYAEYAVGL